MRVINKNRIINFTKWWVKYCSDSQLDVRSPGTFQKLNIIEWQVGGTDWHIFSLFVQQKYLTDMANSNSLAIYNLQIQNTKSKYINNL